MGGERGVGERYRRASPWPLFVAIGLAVAEGGVLFGSVPVALGGLVLLAGSVVGIVRESGVAATAWRPAVALAAVYALGGGAAVGLTPATVRGRAILAAGVVVGLTAVALWLVETRRL